MSLIQTTALDLWGFKNADIDSRILEYQDNFCEHLLRLFHQSKVWAEERPTPMDLTNYTVFRNTYLSSKPITYNNKNLTFYTNTNLWDRFAFYLQRKRERGTNPDLAKDPSQEKILSDILTTEEHRCLPSACDIDLIPLYKEDEYHSFFGCGEFPILVFYIVRIGNQEYSFWDISR